MLFSFLWRRKDVHSEHTHTAARFIALLVVCGFKNALTHVFQNHCQLCTHSTSRLTTGSTEPDELVTCAKSILMSARSARRTEHPECSGDPGACTTGQFKTNCCWHIRTVRSASLHLHTANDTTETREAIRGCVCDWNWFMLLLGHVVVTRTKKHHRGIQLQSDTDSFASVAFVGAGPCAHRHVRWPRGRRNRRWHAVANRCRWSSSLSPPPVPRRRGPAATSGKSRSSSHC